METPDDWTPTYEVVLDAVTFPRERLGEPRSMKKVEFDRWLAKVEAESYRKGYEDGMVSSLESA